MHPHRSLLVAVDQREQCAARLDRRRHQRHGPGLLRLRHFEVAVGSDCPGYVQDSCFQIYILYGQRTQFTWAMPCVHRQRDRCHVLAMQAAFAQQQLEFPSREWVRLLRVHRKPAAGFRQTGSRVAVALAPGEEPREGGQVVIHRRRRAIGNQLGAQKLDVLGQQDAGESIWPQQLGADVQGLPIFPLGHRRDVDGFQRLVPGNQRRQTLVIGVAVVAGMLGIREVPAVLERACLDLMKDCRPELGGVFDVGFRDRESQELPAPDAPPHEHDAQLASMYLDAGVLGQLGF